MDADGPANGVKLPSRLHLKFFAGSDGSYQLYEDDGETQSYRNGDFALTSFSQSLNGETLELNKLAVTGQPEAVLGFPMIRDYDFEIIGISRPTEIKVSGAEVEFAFSSTYDETSKSLLISIANVAATEELSVHLAGIRLETLHTTPISRLTRMMHYFRLPTLAKGLFMQKIPLLLTNPAAIFEISNHFTKPQLLAIYEGIFPRSENKPLSDAGSAFERMMSQMRKRMR